MVKPEFSNLEIDFWVHRGRLGVSQPSFCLFHNCIQVGSPILNALNELKDETCPVQRMLTFAACSREHALTNLRLKAVSESDELRVMNIQCDTDVATIEMTDVGLALLIDACAAWLAGAEDFGVSPRRSTLNQKEFGRLDLESGELWFWGPGYVGP
jgi:hypothetical protein